MTRPRHIVVVARYKQALADWSPRLVSINKCRMTGIDDQDRLILFVALRNPDRLRGLRADSWEFSACALAEPGAARKRLQCEGLMAAREIPYVETGEQDE